MSIVMKVKMAKKIWHITLIVLVIGLVILAVVGVFLFARSCGLITTKPVIERSLPENVGMLYEIKTPSRIYYAESVISTDEGITITEYWAFISNKWLFREGAKSLSYDAYGEIEVTPPSAPPE